MNGKGYYWHCCRSTHSGLPAAPVYQIAERKKVEVSPIMFLLLLGGNGLWVYYGILLDELPIIATNAFAVMMDTIMLVLKFVFRKNSR